jgi:hypothetical protein
MVEGALARRLGTGDAVVIGLGSMIGAGVFSAFAPAAAAAGSGLLIGLALAAGVAYCNAVASAQLAAQYPTSGGTYVYGRERLGEWWGFLAGWGFVVGKTASCAAMALTFATYAVPGSEWAQRLAALLAVAALTAANYHGITRTAGLARVLVAASVLALLIVVVAIAASGNTDTVNLGGSASLWSGGVYGVLQSAALLFFAFAGYARIATLGEEVRDPEHTIPKAIPIALGITVVLYAAVALAALLAAGPDALAAARPRCDSGQLAGGLGRPDRPCRRGRREPRALLARRGHRPHLAGDGAQRGPAGLARGGYLGTGFPVTPSLRSRPSCRAGANDRPARRDRFSSFGSHLLRDRERRRTPARGAATWHAAERHRARGLRRARGRPPLSAIAAGLAVLAAGLAGRLILRGEPGSGLGQEN